MGGGGFSQEPRNLRLDRYVISLARKPRPRVTFLPTASGDAKGYMDRFYRSMGKLNCRPSHFSLFRAGEFSPNERLLESDIIYVGGGNTADMLAIWRLHGVDRVLREAWRNGVILCGLSAGMICWFESSLTDSFGRLRELKDGLGLLRGSACPHYDGERRRRPAYRRLIRRGVLPAGFAADDGAAIHFVDRELLRCVASRPQAGAYRVERRGDRAVERRLPTVYLNSAGEIPG